MSDNKYPNSGSLFVNDRKTKDTHPDYTGSGNFDGKDVWISGWKKQTKAGKTFLSLSWKEKEAVTGEKPAAAAPALADDDVPF